MNHIKTTLVSFQFCLQVILAGAQSITIEQKPAVSDDELTRQDAEKSEVYTAALAGVVYPLSLPLAEGEGTNEREGFCESLEEDVVQLENIKSRAESGLDLADFPAAGVAPNEQSVMSAISPVIYSNFIATALGSGNPPGNCIAISNTGYIVTAVNSTIAMYNSSGTLLTANSLYNFMNGAGNGVVNEFYNPNILFDSQSNRFFLVCRVGSNANDSRIALGFSSSNNPTSAWYFYYLPGNFLNNNTWFDFPRIAYSTNEVYVAGNLYSNNNEFNQVVMFQIPKAAGYSGQYLNYQYWYNLAGSPFSLCPVSYGGNGSYGPGVYMVSHNSGSGAQTKFYVLTGDMSAGNETINYTPINVSSYSIGANASQGGTPEKLDVGDGRIQNAVYMNGIIHYVYCSQANGSQNGIHYDRLTVSNKTIVNKRIYATGGEVFAYPAVVWAGTTSADKSVLISFLYCKPTGFPGAGIVNVDNSNSLSTWTTCAAGLSYVDQYNSNSAVSQWGYSTGLCRNSGSNPLRVWGSACFGNAGHNFTSKVFQVGINGFAEEPEDRNAQLEKTTKGMSVFPNPVSSDLIHLTLETGEEAVLQVRIISLDGAILRTVQCMEATSGLNQIAVNAANLPSGNYFLQVIKDGEVLGNEKFVLIR